MYASDAGLDRLDHTLLIKIGEQYFPVFPADDIPADALGLPEPALDDLPVHNPPSVKQVLIAKAERAGQLLRWATPYTTSPPDMA